METRKLDDSRTQIKLSQDEYVHKNKRTDYLLTQHRKLVTDGFKPWTVAVWDPDETHPLIHVPCSVCGYSDLVGIIEWKNPETGDTRHTGFTCFGRVAKKLPDISEKERRILVWVSQNRDLFNCRKYSLAEAEHIRLLSYVYPISKVYGGKWEQAVSDIYSQRMNLELTPLQLGVLETLHSRSGPYWRGYPTPRQRTILQEIIHEYLKAGFDPSPT